jgi:hypothetical protein
MLLNCGSRRHYVVSRNLQNAGAHWVNQEVVHGLENYRNRDDILALKRKIIEVFSDRTGTANSVRI